MAKNVYKIKRESTPDTEGTRHLDKLQSAFRTTKVMTPTGSGRG